MIDKSIFAVIATNIFIVIVVLIAAPQATLLNTWISSLLIFLWGIAIFTIGIPRIKKRYQEKLLSIPPVLLIVMTTLVPYILLLLSKATTLTSIPIFLMWYLLPAILFIIPQFIQINWIKITSNILGGALLWIGFDHRYTSVLFEGYNDMSYIMNAFWLAYVAISEFGLYQGITVSSNTNDHGLSPTVLGSKIANIAAISASIIIVPFGLLTTFLEWNPQEFNITTIIISFIGIYLTIALQEELIFRGIFLNQAIRNTENQKLYYILFVIIAMLFALTHWNNETPKFVYHYFFAAFVAGLAYGYAYQKGGIFASMFAHTLIDWIWALLLKHN